MIATMLRYATFAGSVLGLLLMLALAAFGAMSGIWLWLLVAIFAALVLVGLMDLNQTRHAVLRNYPILGHVRYFFEMIRPEIRQYLIESDDEEVPFSREARAIVYQRAKNVEDKRPFGTKMKVYSGGYQWLTHSIQPKKIKDTNFRIQIGGPDCSQPYSASIYNISAMSFGALSANAISALNNGARIGGFAHDTGEGALPRQPPQGGGGRIWRMRSGCFC